MVVREHLTITGDSRDAEASLEKARRSFLNLSTVLEVGLGNALQQAATGIVRLGADALQMGIDAEEAANAFAVTFGDAVGQLTDEVEDFALLAGATGDEMQTLLSRTGGIARGFGATREEAALLSEETVRLAADLVSLRNVEGGLERVTMALNSSYAGEAEALKSLGIVIRQQAVIEQALTDTGKARADDLTQLEKAQATYTIAVQQSGDAIGDLERTQDSAANTQRRLNAMLRQAQGDFGQALIPAIQELLPRLIEMVPVLTELATGFADLGGAILSAAAPALDQMPEAIRGVIFLGQTLGAVFFEDAARAKDLSIALDNAIRSVDAGKDPVAAYANAWQFLAERQSASQIAQDRLTRALGLTDEQAEAAMRTVAQWARDTGNASTEAGILADQVERAGVEHAGLHEAWLAGLIDAEEYTRRLRFMELVAGGTGDEIELLAPKTDLSAEAMWRATQQLRRLTDTTSDARIVQVNFGADLPTQDVLDYAIAGEGLVEMLREAEAAAISTTDALLAAADPVFAAADAFSRYQDVLAAANEDSAVTADEQLEIAEAALRAQAAFDALGVGANLENAILAIATALGTSADEAAEFLRQLGLLDGQTVTVVVDANVGPVGEARRAVERREGLIDAGAFAAGGIIPGSPSEAFRATVHGGEIIVPARGPAGLAPQLQAQLAAGLSPGGTAAAGGAGINIENAVFEIEAAGFDLTNPAEARRMVRAVGNAIRRTEAEGPRRPSGVGIT